jgi:hypothetical protein
LKASAMSLAQRFGGASAGRVATGWRSEISLSVGTDSGSAIASATQQAITTYGHHRTKSPNRPKTPPFAAVFVVSICRDTQYRRNHAD